MIIHPSMLKGLFDAPLLKFSHNTLVSFTAKLIWLSGHPYAAQCLLIASNGACHHYILWLFSAVMKTFIFVCSNYDLSTLKSYELLFAISYCFTLSPPLHIISTMRATSTAFFLLLLCLWSRMQIWYDNYLCRNTKWVVDFLGLLLYLWIPIVHIFSLTRCFLFVSFSAPLVSASQHCPH